MPLPGSAREEAALTGSSPAGRSIGLVGLSVIASGLLINAFLAVVAHNVSTEQYGFFTAYWSMALVVGFGVFLPIEQEFTRLAHSAGAGGGVLRSGLRVALGFAAVEVVLVLAGTPLLLHSFGGEFGTVAALATLCVISAGQFTVRGLLLGANRMTSYALVLTADAALRVTLAALLAGLLRPANASSYAWTLVLAIGVAHLPLLPKLVRGRAGIETSVAESTDGSSGERITVRGFAAAAGQLLLGSLCAQLLLNGVPVLVPAVAGAGEHATAGQFQAAFLLARVPLFVAVPLQTAILPALTRMMRTSARHALARALSWFAGGILALCGCALVVAYTIGPWLVRLVFGGQYRISHFDLALLAVGVAVHLGLIIATQALVAASRHTRVAASWLTGLAVAALVFAMVPNLLLRAELSFGLGSLAGWLVATWTLLRAQRAISSTENVDNNVRNDR